MTVFGGDSSPHGSSSTRHSSGDNSTLHGSGIADGATITHIAAHGDLLLQVEHEIKGCKAKASFRVSTSALKKHCRYFERLLQTGRFGEGSAVEARHEILRTRYQVLAQTPASDLPVIRVQDVGRISVTKSIITLCADFLYILHGKDTQTFPHVANLANLAIVADRFDALDVVRSYVGRKKMVRAIDGKTTPRADNAFSEEKVRHRLLVAIMLDYPSWAEKYSARLITRGWVGRATDETTALWWDLPSRVEEELLHRRECVLETVQSLQSYFLGLYTSRERQCKLGYDSSPQCDSFQLGEMVRFFTRAGTLRLQGGVFDSTDPPDPFADDVNILLDTLRQVPEYQIDRHHSHCGIRTRLTPLLDLVAECVLHIGICSECWVTDRASYAWIDAKKPIVWKRQTFTLRAQGHRNKHADLRAMFTASERDWS